MAVNAENTCFENMGFAPYSVFAIQQEQDHLPPPLNRYYDFALPPSSSSSSSVDNTVQSLDGFIQLESKRLRRSILEEQSRLQAIITQQYESRMKSLMLQKEGELAMAKSRRRNLQDLLKVAEMEGRAWENVVREREAIVSDLENRLNVAKERGRETASFCDSSSSCSGGEREMVCKLCQNRRACVVLLPCRHFCCCKLCEPLLEHCPLCRTIKDSSLDAFLA